jgi:hypothetical protein
VNDGTVQTGTVQWSNAAPARIQAHDYYRNSSLIGRVVSDTQGRFIRVSNDAYNQVYAQFKLANTTDDAAFTANKHIYLAIKDISQNPSNVKQQNPAIVGTPFEGNWRDYNSYPGIFYDQSGSGYATDANNLNLIKRIDYVLPSVGVQTDNTPPAAPRGLRVQ